jgi:hypothetical protein
MRNNTTANGKKHSIPVRTSAHETSIKTSHETCEKFLLFISERYPQIKGLRFKLLQHGRCLWIRGRYRRRQLYTFGSDVEYVMSRFLLEILRKAYQEKYYELRAELETVRKLLEKRQIMNYFIYELKTK